MAQINVRPLGDFKLVFLGAEEIPATEKTDKKMRLNFAAPAYVKASGRQLKCNEVGDLLGSNWSSKVDMQMFIKLKPILGLGKFYDCTAAIDSYSMDNGKMQGNWYEILNIQAAENA